MPEAGLLQRRQLIEAGKDRATPLSALPICSRSSASAWRSPARPTARRRRARKNRSTRGDRRRRRPATAKPPARPMRCGAPRHRMSGSWAPPRAASWRPSCLPTWRPRPPPFPATMRYRAASSTGREDAPCRASSRRRTPSLQRRQVRLRSRVRPDEEAGGRPRASPSRSRMHGRRTILATSPTAHRPGLPASRSRRDEEATASRSPLCRIAIRQR